MMNDTIQIACASDERYFPGLLGTLTSILVNTTHKKGIIFHIIDGGIKEDSWEFLKTTLKKFHNIQILRYFIDQSHFDGFPDFFYDSKMAYARLLLPKLLSEEKVIYIDSDILFFKDIKLLWNLNFDGHAAIVALESSIPYLKDDCPNIEELKLEPTAPYFNSGIMYFNLAKFREKKISFQAIQYLKNHKDNCKYWDQSALNVVLYKDFKLLDQNWNTQSHRKTFLIEERIDDFKRFEVNYHFVTSSKPWLRYNDNPQNLLFYSLLDELGYILTDPTFINSKKTYKLKIKFVRFLPMFYSIRSLLKKLNGQLIKAENDRKIAQFWREQLSIEKWKQDKKKVINEMDKEWRKKVRHSQRFKI